MRVVGAERLIYRKKVVEKGRKHEQLLGHRLNREKICRSKSVAI